MFFFRMVVVANKRIKGEDKMTKRLLAMVMVLALVVMMPCVALSEEKLNENTSELIILKDDDNYSEDDGSLQNNNDKATIDSKDANKSADAEKEFELEVDNLDTFISQSISGPREIDLATANGTEYGPDPIFIIDHNDNKHGVVITGSYIIEQPTTTVPELFEQSIILVKAGFDGDITLNNIYIDATANGLGDHDEFAAFSIEPGANVNLILKNKNRLVSGHMRAALEVPEGAGVTIKDGGNGVLEALSGGGHIQAGSNGAGIGGRDYTFEESDSCGTIIIESGTIVALADNYGTGIGGGNGGNIIINGGNVTAVGDTGIGGGYNYGGSGGDGGNITINGGAVSVIGTIGGGHSSHGEAGSGGIVSINGGTIDVIGHIGGGIGQYGGDGGSIKISGGKTTVYSRSNSAAIGGGGSHTVGFGLFPGGDGGNITITGGTVNAYSNYVGIGGGSGQGDSENNYIGGNGASGNITISGEKTVVNAYGLQNDIGGAYDVRGNLNNEGSTSITSGSVYALSEKITGFSNVNMKQYKVTVINGSGNNKVNGVTVFAGTYKAVTGSNIIWDNSETRFTDNVQNGVAYIWADSSIPFEIAANYNNRTVKANRVGDYDFVIDIYTPPPPTRPSGGSGGSGGGGGGGGGGGRTTQVTTASSAATTTASSPLTADQASAAFNTGLTAAKAAGSAAVSVRVTNKDNIPLEVMQNVAQQAKNNGKAATIHADTVDASGSLLTRLYISPEKAIKAVNAAARYDDTAVSGIRTVYNTHFKNKVAVLQLGYVGALQPGQTREMGMEISLATKISLAGMDTTKLYFYIHDPSTNFYYPMTTAYSIDSVGFLHFKASKNGYVIISEGPLARK